MRIILRAEGMMGYARAPRIALSRVATERWARLALYVPVSVLVLSLLVLVAIQLRWARAFIGWPIEIMYGEALIQDHAARLVRGEALYQQIGQPSYTIANYTPLFYALMAAAQAFFGASLLFGRVTSAIAAIITALLLARLAARDGRGPAAGLLAAALYVSFGFPTPFPWFALGKEDVLGVGFGVACVSVLTGGQTNRRVLAAGALAALAILTKQSLIAAFLAGTGALALYDRRAAIGFALACLVPVGVVCAAFELTTHAFVANTVVANAQGFRLDILQTNLATLKAYQAGPLAVAAFGALRRLYMRQSFEDVLLPGYWLATMVPLVGLASVGSAQNYWIELAASTAALAASEIWFWLRRTDVRLSAVGAMLAALPLVNVVVAGRLALIWLPAVNMYDDPTTMTIEFAPLVELVREVAGDVLAEPLDSVMLAGKPALVEPWAADAMYQSGAWDIQPLVERMCAGEVRLAVLAHPIEDTVVAYHDYAIWPAPLLEAMRQRMVLQEVRAARFLYVPRAGASCGTLHV